MSQTITALIKLRELILSGRVAAGERLLETVLADQFGVSRTPIRTALMKLADEGLLEKLPNGGYSVREFSQQDIEESIEMRGTIEGFAARLAAEGEPNPDGFNRMKETVRQIDRLLSQQNLSDTDTIHYFELNDAFHAELVALTGSFVVAHMLERVMTLPLAAPSSFASLPVEDVGLWQLLFVAQEQHHGLIEAIERGQGARAAALALEHARVSLKRIMLVFKNQEELEPFPGSQLIQMEYRGTEK